METFRIGDMTNGWFVGDFDPAVLRTKDFEVGLHRHRQGEPTEPHYHLLAPEINVVIRGELRVNGSRIEAGDIFVFCPGEVCEVEFLADTELIVVKAPSVPGDKYAADSAEFAGASERG